MDNLFQKCVDILNYWAEILGMTYNEINIWIFVIIEPVVLVLMITWICRLYYKLWNAKKKGVIL